MMKFREIKAALKTLLDAQSLGRFDVIGYQRQSKSSSEFTKLVTVYYNSGDFPKSSTGIYGSNVEHNSTIVVELSVSAKAEIDLSILNDPLATALERSAAIAALQTGGSKADDLIDELFDDVFQIIMDPRNSYFGLDENYFADRFIENFQKDSPLPQGEDIILTGRFQLTCSCEEELGGETGVPGTAYENTVNIEDDQGNNAGASGTLGG